MIRSTTILHQLIWPAATAIAYVLHYANHQNDSVVA
jgi:hypothetical protein